MPHNPWMVSQYWRRLCIGAVRQQAIAWSSYDPVNYDVMPILSAQGAAKDFLLSLWQLMQVHNVTLSSTNLTDISQ